ncbi:hypothetical protein CWE08_11860 [Aliidiomarina iranensis]|uniref:Uncharacterized protein n=1 Tax=Aliidiomarina iranensis TaxID=1434071 RepID=A0A432VPU7_9GAMM|nr:hypothetical protein [Aliidiomarina iranensis]RUO18174.1 hypothetical protein CWE08_11860 [Aliidiomarina iranensis]
MDGKIMLCLRILCVVFSIMLFGQSALSSEVNSNGSHQYKISWGIKIKIFGGFLQIPVGLYFDAASINKAPARVRFTSVGSYDEVDLTDESSIIAIGLVDDMKTLNEDYYDIELSCYGFEQRAKVISPGDDSYMFQGLFFNEEQYVSVFSSDLEIWLEILAPMMILNDDKQGNCLDDLRRLTGSFHQTGI